MAGGRNTGGPGEVRRLTIKEAGALCTVTMHRMSMLSATRSGEGAGQEQHTVLCSNGEPVRSAGE